MGKVQKDYEKFSLWKKLTFSLIPACLFFGLLEAGLFVAGVESVLLREDPFVGFASNVSLFNKKKDPQGRQLYETNANKLSHFNHQTFPQMKKPETYRIFSLGGSTTYGRPYNDSVSFSAWLREFLPVADPDRHWEVINAGGISYASYRVARLMEELLQYEPDLFIIYTGHNEFLERRSYGALQSAGGMVTSVAGTLARTRTWTAFSWFLERFGALPENGYVNRATLPGEVDTILKKYGPGSYKRDDAQRKKIIEHYRFSLERMISVGKSAGIDIIFVTPVSNLKDCSPFRSEHTDGLTDEQRARSEEFLAEALKQIENTKWTEALALLDKALLFDPRFAELHYRRGKTLIAFHRYDEARIAFQRALKEDVCPLRMLQPMQEVLAEISETNAVPLVNVVEHLEQRLQVEEGHTITGEEYFLDHVHPSVEGHRLVAESLIEMMISREILTPTATWGAQAITDVSNVFQSRFDKRMKAEGLANLARVLDWSGKHEESAQLAMRTLELDVDDPTIISNAASILAIQYLGKGEVDEAWRYFRVALHATPMNPTLHFQIGQWVVDTQNRKVEVGFAHILHASVFWSGSGRDRTHLHLGVAMAQRGRSADALAHFLEAQRLNPDNADAKRAINQMREQFGNGLDNVVLQKVSVEKYPSGAVSRIVQVKPDPAGKFIPDGFWTEWYEGGEPKRFLEYVNGTPKGTEMTWDHDLTP